jgi:hypothetical protein
MKYIITESQHNKIIDKFITYQFEPHEEKRTKNKPDSIFWVKDGEVIAEINKNSGYFWVESQIWNTISSMFSLEYSETQQVIKDWLEEHYKLGGLTPFLFHFAKQVQLEEHYKLGGLTPWKISNTKLQSWRHIKLD